MLLAVDVGNTQTVIGLFEDGVCRVHRRMATKPESTSDELRVLLRQLLELDALNEADIVGMALSSVVPELTATWCRAADGLGCEPLVVSPSKVPFLPITYDYPNEIGADRLADAVAAVNRYGAPVIVVDLGTATNIEVIDKDGAFVGGIIAPGVMASADALFAAAARLARVDLVAPEKPIGTNTRAAVQSGLVYGEVDRIDGLVRRVIGQLGYAAPVIATGGLAGMVAPLSTTVTAHDENLTLEGLHDIYEWNRKHAD